MPLPSPSTRPGFIPRPVSFIDAVKEIFAFWRGRGPSLREMFLQAQRVQRLADEIDEIDEAERRENAQRTAQPMVQRAVERTIKRAATQRTTMQRTTAPR